MRPAPTHRPQMRDSHRGYLPPSLPRAGTTLGYLVLLLLLIQPLGARAQLLSVSLCDTCNLQALSLSPQTDSYFLQLDRIRCEVPRGAVVGVARVGDSLYVRLGDEVVGFGRHLALVREQADGAFWISTTLPGFASRLYDGNASIFVDFHRLMCVNLVRIPDYVAGVIVAEVGPKAPIEAYKAQCALVQTYIYANRGRHLPEGYNLCDGTHCQAYQGSARGNALALQAAREMEGLVVLSESGDVVNGVFHANCGGQTASAGDVWLREYDYLRAVDDPYCRQGRGARWNAQVRLEDWTRFLASKGVDVSKLRPRDYAYRSARREAIYTLPGGVGVPFRDLREYFALKSAWFDVIPRGNRLLLVGRGYGHGIGLCQEGAIRMARKGFDARSILRFYFKNVHLGPPPTP